MKKILQFASFFLFLVVMVHIAISSFKVSTTFLPDFSIFYTAAKDSTHHILPYTDNHLYTVFNYPLVTAAFFLPFTFFDIHRAQWIFTFLNIISVFAIVFFSLRLSKEKITTSLYLFLSSLVFLSFPTKFTLGMGQTNLIAYSLLLWSFSLWKKQYVFSFLLFCLALLLKPLLGFMVLFFIFQKDWKFVGTSFVVILLCIFLTPIVFSLPYANSYYISYLIPQLTATTGREVYYNQGLLGFLARLIQNGLIRGIVFYFLFLLLFVFLLLRLPKYTPEKLFAFLLTFLVIFDTLSWQHHFVFLIFPFILFSVDIIKTKKKIWIFLLVFAYILVSINIKNPFVFQHFPFSLLLSHTFYGALILFIVEFLFIKKINQQYGRSVLEEKKKLR